jgi:hypothetical protein
MLTQERLHALFEYDAASGNLIWRLRPRSDFTSNRSFNGVNSRRAGKVAGNIDCLDGYRKIGIDGRLYRAHRLVWMHVYGTWPEGEVDHINQVKSDNRLENLRVATRTENARNAPVRRDNTSGHPGIRQRSNSWRAFIGNRCLGTFQTLERAIEARKEAERAEDYYANSMRAA